METEIQYHREMVEWAGGGLYQELWFRLGVYSKARNIEAERTCV